MTTAARRPPRSVDDLEPADRDRLARAHKRLREATDTYEPFHGGEITPNQDAPVHEVLAMAAAQAEVQDAEDALWRLREELLAQAPECVLGVLDLGLRSRHRQYLMLSLIHISEPTRRTPISYAVFCLK